MTSQASKLRGAELNQTTDVSGSRDVTPPTTLSLEERNLTQKIDVYRVPSYPRHITRSLGPPFMTRKTVKGDLGRQSTPTVLDWTQAIEFLLEALSSTFTAQPDSHVSIPE